MAALESMSLLNALTELKTMMTLSIPAKTLNKSTYDIPQMTYTRT